MMVFWYHGIARILNPLIKTLLLLAVCHPIVVVWADEDGSDENESADKLIYQEALFHFYRNDYMQTLVMLESDHLGTTHIDNEYHNLNHLLAIEAGFKLGMLDTVSHTIEHLAFTARDKRIKQQAQFYKGKLAYYRKDWRGAIKLLQDINPALPAVLRDEALYYQANSHLNSNQQVEAARVLGGISSNTLWGAYGYFNLGTAYANREKSPSKALVAFRVAATFTDTSEEGMELKDHINLAAGKLALQGNDYDKSMGFLQEVRVSGTAAPGAILHYGRAQAGQGRQRTAIQSWYRAKIFGLVVPGVADIFLSIAYGYEQEKLKATAIDSYMEAIASYEKELRHTAEINKELRGDGVLALLKKVQSDDSSVEWFLASQLAANTPRVAFVYFLMNDRAFFDKASLMLELNGSANDIARGSQRLEALALVLQKRVSQAGRSGKGKPVKVLDEATFQGLVAQRNALVAAYKTLSEGPQKLAAAVEIRALDGELHVLKRRYGSVTEKVADASGFYASQLKEVLELSARFKQLRSDLQTEIAEIDRQLTEEALGLLESHRLYIDDYYVRSQLALVNLYDEIAVSELQKSVELQDANQGGAL
jgi:hypothetical protein